MDPNSKHLLVAEGLQWEWNISSGLTSLIDLLKNQTLNQEPWLCWTHATSYVFDLFGKWSLPYVLICLLCLLSCTQSCCLHGQSLTVIQNKALWGSGRHVWCYYSHMLSVKVHKLWGVNDHITQWDRAGGQESNWAVKTHPSWTRGWLYIEMNSNQEFTIKALRPGKE